MERLTYTVSEVAQALGISRSKAYTLVAEGAIAVVQLPGRRKLVARAALDRLLGTTEPTTDRPNTPTIHQPNAPTHDGPTRSETTTNIQSTRRERTTAPNTHLPIPNHTHLPIPNHTVAPGVHGSSRRGRAL